MRSINKIEFFKTLEQSEIGKQSLDIIQRVQREVRGQYAELGFELHRIHPVSLGGEDLPCNLVKLTLFEHCLVHLLLAMVFEVPETYFVLNKMSGKIYRNLSELERISLEEVHHWSEIRNNLKASVRGLRCSVSNDEGVSKKVIIADLPFWESQGFKRGLPEKCRAENRIRNLGKVTVSNEKLQVNKMIPKQDLQKYLDQGWNKGTGEKQRVNHGKSMKGKVRVCREDIGGIMINAEDLQKYLDQGYVRGRTKAYKDSISGKTVVNSNGTVRKVAKDQVDEMLQEGWSYGWGDKLKKS